jgi:uncharacterized protein YaeQ
MAIKSTIFKAELQIADMDRNHYLTHFVTIARHPSENDERMMARILVYALHADESLEFTKGLSTEDEPDLWQKNLSGEIVVWIELGQPDIKRIRKACGRADKVFIYTYNQRAAEVWWRHHRETLMRFGNLTVVSLPEDAIKSLANLTQRTMQLQCTIQDGHVWMGDSNESVFLILSKLKEAEAAN